MAKGMAKQMELFEPVERGFDEGGLMDEGGTVDPVSGNEVPPGSTQEEVRDDIPAQLSEGEFVFPADVVRYIGLENLMRMRQEAKQGLAQMDAMGQMGNSEEATIEDNLPFDMYDLDVEDDDQRNFNVGGYVAPTVPTNPYNQPGQVNPQTGTYTLPGTGIAGYQVPTGGQTGYTPYGGAAPYFQPVQFAGPQFQTATQTTNLPTFAETVGSNIGKYDELRTYINDAGQILQIPFKDGKPIYPIPEGYRPQGDQPTAEQPTTTPVTTTPVTNQGDGGGDSPNYGGGTSLLTGEKIAGYSPEEIKSGVASAKDRYAIDGNRGFDLLNIIPGGSFIKSLMPDSVSATIFGEDPTYTGRPDDALMDKQRTAREELQQSLGTRITGYVGFQKGDLDPNSGGFFDKNGIAVDPRTGDQTKNESGTMNYSSLSDWKEAFAAGTKSGWRGGKLGKESYGDLSEKAKANYDKFADIMGYDDHKAKDTKTKTDKGYPSGVTQRDFGKETASEAAAREAANREQAARQQAARDERDSSDRDGGIGESDGGDYGSDAGTGGGGDMGVICLTEDMKVKRNGVVDFVTNVKVGDIVDNTVVTEVLHKHMREGYYVVNGELKITNDHPVLANGSWKHTEDLVLGDYINNVKVTSLEYVEQVTPTVYISTADDRYDVYTEGNVYTVHGQYKNALKKAA